jgi:hypothetical protein
MDTRYKPTAASLEPETGAADIDDLNISEKWKERFRIIEKAGPIERGKYKNHKALTPAELRKVNMKFARVSILRRLLLR